MTKIFCTAKNCHHHEPEYSCKLPEIEVTVSKKGGTDDTECNSFNPKEM